MKCLLFLISILPWTFAQSDFAAFVARYKDCELEGISNDPFHHETRKFGSEMVVNITQLLEFLQGIAAPGDSISNNFGSTDLDCGTLNLLNSEHQGILINSSLFYEMCPTIVNLLNLYKQEFNSRDLLEEEPMDTAVLKKPSRQLVWGFGFLAVTIISLCSLVGISFLPLMKTKKYDFILLYLITLAVGTLCSNALFQLIPEGFGIDSDPMTVWRSAVIFGGFYMFYFIENILERIFNQSHTHNTIDNDSELTHLPPSRCEENHSHKKQTDVSPFPTSNDLEWNNKSNEDSQKTLSTSMVSVNETAQTSSKENCIDPKFYKKNLAPKKKQLWIFKNYKTIKTIAWMITIADGIHNFIDGLAIGASFSTSMIQGISTSLAIFCEEFPHELGDFAILISSGMTVRQAAFYNFTSACCCYFGLIVGILIGHDVSSAQWIFALAGGVFLYISLAGMLPEAQAQCSGKDLKKSPWTCLIVKHLGLFSGFLVMFLLTLYKDKITL